MADEQTRERVRALVRSVLETALPADEPETASDVTHGNVIPSAPSDDARKEQEVARDESSKTVVTETAVRDLSAGARLRISESARVTPLAADIIRERRIERVPRPARPGRTT